MQPSRAFARSAMMIEKAPSVVRQLMLGTIHGAVTAFLA